VEQAVLQVLRQLFVDLGRALWTIITDTIDFLKKAIAALRHTDDTLAADASRAGKGAGVGLTGGSGGTPDGGPTGTNTPPVPNPLDMVPEGASRRVLAPDPNGGAQEGIEFKWTNEQGQTIRLRIHGPDGTAPPGSNAAGGPIYRVQVGGRYMDAEGNLYPRGIHNPNSPNYDPEAANATHIPWPSDIPLPW
jgi:hypothetical protein